MITRSVCEILGFARDDGNDEGPRLPGIRAQYEKAPQPKELIVLDGSTPANIAARRLNRAGR